VRALRVVHEAGDGRVVTVDSLTYCDARVAGGDVVVGGSFAGTLALGFALEWGVRAVIAHAAGVGKDGAGIAGLALAQDRGVPAAAVETMSARLGDGTSVWEEGTIAHVNGVARLLGVEPGMTARAAALAMLAAPWGRRLPGGDRLVDRSRRVVAETPAGRVVLMGSTTFADESNRRDVLCVGSHGGRVNALPLEAIRPRGLVSSDGGRARDDSGLSGLLVLEGWGVAAVTVDAMSARIGEPDSVWESGLVSAVNPTGARAGVAVGQTVQEAARRILRADSGARFPLRESGTLASNPPAERNSP
jgi:hypothetical protein